MSSSNTDVITMGMMLRKVPSVIRRLPNAIKGIKASNIKDPTQPCGLGLTVEMAVEKNPYGTALLYEDTRYSYAEFNAWANRISHYLLSRGVKKGDTVAVLIENRPELLAVVTGIAKIGGVSAMLNTSQTGKVLIHSYNLVEPKMAIVGEELVDTFNEVRSDLNIESDNSVFFLADAETTKEFGTAPEGYVNLAEEIKDASSNNPETCRQIYMDDPCFYIYTSGTTGLPKAGVFKHGRWMKSWGGFGLATMQMKTDDVLYSTLPLYHATGLCVCWGSTLAAGAGFAIRRKFSATKFWDDVRKFNATAIGYVGELCRYLMSQEAKPNDKDNPVVKMIGNGLRPGIWIPFKKRFGVKEVYELYAASDGNIGFTNMFNFDNTVGFSPVSWELVKYDKEKEEPVRDNNGHMLKVGRGENGLLVAKIDSKAPLDGYTDPEKTKKVILSDVFEKGDRWFNTGDMLKNIGFGHLQFVDRLGDTYRWKGENVSTTEIENIVSSHPKISEAVVYGVEIPETNGRAGMASITPEKGDVSILDFKEIHSFFKAQMPLYAIPLFLRIKTTIDTTGTFKYKKSDLKDESYDISKTNGEAIYALLPGSDEYVEVDADMVEAINTGKYRF